MGFEVSAKPYTLNSEPMLGRVMGQKELYDQGQRIEERDET